MTDLGNIDGYIALKMEDVQPFEHTRHPLKFAENYNR